MILPTVLRGVMHVVDTVQAANQRKAAREIARVAARNSIMPTERKSEQPALRSR